MFKITSFLKTTQPHQISHSRSSETRDKKASRILRKTKHKRSLENKLIHKTNILVESRITNVQT